MDCRADGEEVQERLDITEGERGSTPEERVEAGPQGRPFLMVMFECANAYRKVFRSVDGGHYLARCPKCGLTKRFGVGSGGADQRQFRLSCR
jgi:hypothetical protein